MLRPRRLFEATIVIGCLSPFVWRPWNRSASETVSVSDAATPAAATIPQRPAAVETPAVETAAGAVPDAPTEVSGDLATTPADPQADRLRRLVLGVWVDEFFGTRTFTFRDDGTATMTIDLDQVGRLIYGPRLTFQIAWELHGDVIKLRMVSGEPRDSAMSVAKLFGETSEQRIERAADDELQLRSLDSQKLYTHRRKRD